MIFYGFGKLSNIENDIHIGLTLKKLVNLYKRKVLEVQSRIPGVSGISTVQGWVICFIFDQIQIKDVFQRDVEAELDIRKSSATTLLQRMEKNGLIIRNPMPNDARWKKLELTQKAIDFRNELKARMLQVEKHATEGLSEHDVDLFLHVADIIAKNLDTQKTFFAETFSH